MLSQVCRPEAAVVTCITNTCNCCVRKYFLFITKIIWLLRSLVAALPNKLRVTPRFFLRCIARKQQQLPVLQIPVTAAGENILFIAKRVLVIIEATCNICRIKYQYLLGVFSGVSPESSSSYKYYIYL